MADFSRFGTPSKEWNDYAEKYGLPLQLARPGLNPVALQKSTNEGRETDSARRMREEGAF
jgi:hypothetical protein